MSFCIKQLRTPEKFGEVLKEHQSHDDLMFKVRITDGQKIVHTSLHPNEIEAVYELEKIIA